MQSAKSLSEPQGKLLQLHPPSANPGHPLNRTSDVDVKGGPAVVPVAHAPVLGACLPRLAVGLLPGGGGARLAVILVVLVEEAVLHHAEAGGGAQVLAAALVLLDGLVERPQLTQQGHVLLTQSHLQRGRGNNTQISRKYLKLTQQLIP